MTPRQYKEYVEAESVKKAEAWHYPISDGDDLLHNVLDKMFDFKLAPKDVPLIIKLIEN